jgi:hypothetical protein
MLFPKKPIARLLTHANSEALDLLAQALGARPGIRGAAFYRPSEGHITRFLMRIIPICDLPSMTSDYTLNYIIPTLH